MLEQEEFQGRVPLGLLERGSVAGDEQPRAKQSHFLSSLR